MTKLNANQLENVEVGDTLPASPYDGQLFFLSSSTETALKLYDGSDWIIVSNENGFYNENLLINGDFQVWQDGTSMSPTGVYTRFPDMCRLTAVGTLPTMTISQQKFTVGQTDVPGEPENYLRLGFTGVTGTTGMSYDIAVEGCRHYAGETVTLSFYGKADSSRSMQTESVQNFGSGGSSQISTVLVNTSFTTSWQKFTYTYDMPSIAGKTVGTGDFIRIFFQLPLDASLVLDLARIKLEKGSVATETPIPAFGDELQKCKRYYEKSYDYGVTPGTTAITNGALHQLMPSNTVAAYQRYASTPFTVEKRTAPTISIYGISGGSGVVSNTSGTDLAAGSGRGVYIGATMFTVDNNSGGTLTIVTNCLLYHWVADARL